jgi:hypothetical protein
MMAASSPWVVTDRAQTIDRLEQSLADILFAVSVTPEPWRYRTPSDDPALRRLGDWSVARNVAHLAVYEEQVAAPILEAIAAGRDCSTDVVSVLEGDYQNIWEVLSGSPLETIVQRLVSARRRQIAAISAMSDGRFHEAATTLWNRKDSPDGQSAAWVATKTFQHTWEHGNSIFRIALFAPA